MTPRNRQMCLMTTNETVQLFYHKLFSLKRCLDNIYIPEIGQICCPFVDKQIFEPQSANLI